MSPSARPTYAPDNSPNSVAARLFQSDVDSLGDAIAERIAWTVGTVNVRSHTFKFVSPEDTERYGVPNPCTACHTDETDEWAIAELRKWPHVSSWRVAP